MYDADRKADGERLLGKRTPPDRVSYVFLLLPSSLAPTISLLPASAFSQHNYLLAAFAP
ncbi:hypothetical protein CC85DRAFT_284463 [Cutaneotrichosporon oleaginosum]|uniref:Uncharacterized protein n=1 Tax=Cutaneotrichosporon oleaginosum TaxID=879819 RepID=A0A0J0XR33_9TREE|nr:uncharacterized protein CC85DRAFT_284463 [Cutaneotrichosporon oleaginosum]KLT43540.1 hypothetical protein CC85DRAFT_284463 [Cutaneotrichosporon oleaginosum]TXT05561.1 hypothetical protein COLE_06881 [Cutaneotrichosporon oleaginosum]